MPKKSKKSGDSGSRFGKLVGGAERAGFAKDEAMAMAYKKIHGGESRGAFQEAVGRLRESMFPHLRRRR